MFDICSKTARNSVFSLSPSKIKPKKGFLINAALRNSWNWKGFCRQLKPLYSKLHSYWLGSKSATPHQKSCVFALTDTEILRALENQPKHQLIFFTYIYSIRTSKINKHHMQKGYFPLELKTVNVLATEPTQSKNNRHIALLRYLIEWCEKNLKMQNQILYSNHCINSSTIAAPTDYKT